MIHSVNHINQINYNTVAPVESNKGGTSSYCSAPKNNHPAFTSASVNFSNIRTSLSGKEEKQKYETLLKSVDKQTKKQLENLLKSGILLNSDSNDNSTVLDNLYIIATTPRAQGLSQAGILKDTVSTIAYPYNITQQFGDIPVRYRQKAINANTEDKTNYVDNYMAHNDIDVQYSGTCVAASIEFNLAKRMPAEFARFAQGLSSPEMSVTKTIKMNNLADNTLDSVWLLNAFEIPFEMQGFEKAKLKFAPDKNAIIRAEIQTTDKDPYERTPLDVLMQSTFMQVGSQQTYNTLTDKRQGKFNQNNKGLIEFEKTFTESVVEDKNKLSVTYQTVDDNARLIGYETDRDTLKRHLTTALNMGENVIIGYTQVDNNNIIINGHEITIIGYKKLQNGKLLFICNDTDDNLSQPIEYDEDYLLPKIHHAALPKSVVEEDVNVTPNWVEGLNLYKQMKAEHDRTNIS